jgi:hypothetical protein
MKTLIPDSIIKNQRADDPWKKKETDKMLDLYLAGGHPKEIAYKLQRNPKAIKRRLEQFTYNERDRTRKYEPRRRISRKGMRWTENEKLIKQECLVRGVPVSDIARVLQRNANEVMPDYKGEIQVNSFMDIAPRNDLLLAHRYLYWVAKKPIISNQAYDAAKKEELEFGACSELLKPASGHAVDYPAHIRYLAFYMLYRKEAPKEIPETDCLPPDCFPKKKK